MDLPETIESQLETVLNHLYINPLEKCNLACKICYTRKTSPILSGAQILAFVERYQAVHQLQTITFCGGEVMALTSFPGTVNQLTAQGIFIQIITNGTIDRLDEFVTPNSVTLIVSLDGLPEYHDANRGEGNFAKSLAFLAKAKRLGFHTEVFSIVTKQNLLHLPEFEQYLARELNGLPHITYHPRKPPLYLQTHPLSNIVGETAGFDFLSREEMRKLMKTKNVFPPKDLGCYQIAVASDGKVYGCCEGTLPLGQMNDDISFLFNKMRARLERWQHENPLSKCLGCSQPDFVCGIKEYLASS
jgi:MoaA/NifB/PqqE/SkfB family radical SAM enzyme